MHILELLDESEYHPSEEVWVECEECDLEEGVAVRQFRRSKGKLRRQFRCMSGDKAGKLVTSRDKCGIRRNPKKVRLGRRAARLNKQTRIRKTLFTKKRAESKHVQRLNKLLRGDFNEV